MPKIFSCPSMQFGHEPYDSELVSLLGDGLPRGAEGLPFFGVAAVGPGRATETEGVLTVGPRTFAMKRMVPLAILATLALSLLVLFGNGEPASVVGRLLVMALLWLVFLPVGLGILWAFNMVNVSAGGFFRADSNQRTLELCRAKRQYRADEIIAFTDLSRYYRLRSSGWNRTKQAGVLVRAGDQCVEWHPVITDRDQSWADRLASIFQVPVRRIHLSKSESRALGDC